MNPNDAATYVVLGNVYASAEMWSEYTSIYNNMVKNKIQKIPGATWVTVNKKIHVFHVDSEHEYLYINIYIYIYKRYSIII